MDIYFTVENIERFEENMRKIKAFDHNNSYSDDMSNIFNSQIQLIQQTLTLRKDNKLNIILPTIQLTKVNKKNIPYQSWNWIHFMAQFLKEIQGIWKRRGR